MPSIAFSNTYRALPERFYRPIAPHPVAAPRLIRTNGPLAALLGIDPAFLASEAGVAMVAGNALPEGAEPIAAAYAGHQFGSFNPQLGDGRAVLLGEVVATDGERYDLQLKGSGPTPFSRGGDGRSPLGPVLREYVVSEAMAALGVPTTRALSAVTTGESVRREVALPGGILLRVARSHIRIGTFEYFAARGDVEALRLLVEYTLARHYPELVGSEQPGLALLRGVAERQAQLVARWQLLGFIHGVMNTDNMLVSGETIDYGPCAFLDAYDPAKVFSSIDRVGRYAYQNQPRVLAWNLACLARALLLVMEGDDEQLLQAAQTVIDELGEGYGQAYADGLRRKLGCSTAEPGDDALGAGLLDAFARERVDFTLGFRRLAELAVGPSPALGESVQELCGLPDSLSPWLERWRARLARDPRSNEARAADLARVNPVLIPRNHLIEAAIRDAEDHDDLTRFQRLVDALAAPAVYRRDLSELARPPRAEECVSRTFCGT